MNRITKIVCDLGKIPGVGPDEDIYEAGFSSIKSLELLLELESEYGVSVPDDQFIAARTPRALHDMIVRVKESEV
jgi:acyl carrier protein